MTNYPPMQPPPPGQPPYGQPPVGGQPPYGQPPGAPYGMPAQPQPGNGWGVAALVTGLVGLCVPVLGGLLAVLFGILGIRRSGKTHTGKGMSIAGLILGVVSLAIWALFGGAIWALIQGTATNRDLAKQFINDLAAKNTTAAANRVDPATVNADELKALSDKISGGGTIQDVTTVGINASSGTSGSQVMVTAIVTYSGGQQKQLVMRQVKVGDQWKIAEVQAP